MSLGTAATVGVILAGAGASTAANIYGTRSAGRQNRRAQDLQAEESRLAVREAAEDRALAAEEARAQRGLEERRMAESQARWTQAQAQDQSRWQDYLRANEPHWNQGGRVLGNLFDLAGMSGGAPSMPNTGAMAGASFDERSAAAPSGAVSAPVGAAPLLSLDDAMASGAPVSTAQPVPRAVPARTQMAPRSYAMAQRPSGGGSSMSQLLSLAEMANRGSRGARASYTGDVPAGGAPRA